MIAKATPAIPSAHVVIRAMAAIFCDVLMYESVRIGANRYTATESFFEGPPRVRFELTGSAAPQPRLRHLAELCGARPARQRTRPPCPVFVDVVTNELLTAGAPTPFVGSVGPVTYADVVYFPAPIR